MRSKRTKKLISFLRRISPVAVAFSGGLDSSVVAAAARLASERSIAITLDDYTLPRKDLNDARDVALACGISHIVIKSSPPNKVLRNERDRCFHCKMHTYKTLLEASRKFGVAKLADGANSDDIGDYRPGMRAAKNLGVVSPLLELGFGKEDVRSIARELKLPVSEKPSSACLSSRIPHGERITENTLKMVESAEEAVRKATGIKKVRVRAHGGIARIEVPPGQRGVFFDILLINGIAKKLRKIGFSHITLDLEGYRPGGR